MLSIHAAAGIPGLPFFERGNRRNPGLKVPGELKEEVWETRTNPDLLRRLCPEDADGCSWVTHAYALYLDTKTNLIPLTCIQSSREIVMPRITFAGLIEQLDPHTWQELVFGCAVHDLCIMEWTDAVFGEHGAVWENPIANWPDFNPNPIVDEMLKDSRGAIIWAHQIHALYSLFDSQVEKMLEFRKILNAKMSDRLREHEGRHFIDGRDLMEIIEERMIFGHTDYLNVRKASVLWRHRES